MKGVLLIQLTDSDKSEILFDLVSSLRKSIPSQYIFFDIDNFSGSDLLSYAKQYIESLTDCICIIYNHTDSSTASMSISKLMNALLKTKTTLFHKNLPDQWHFYLTPFNDHQKYKFDSIEDLSILLSELNNN